VLRRQTAAVLSVSWTDINATQIAGLLSFGGASLFTAWAWRHYRLGTVLCLINGALAAECLVGSRFQAHSVVIVQLKARGLYDARMLPQEYLTVGCVLLAILLFVLMLSRPASRRLAVGATTLAVALFVVETVSLHAIDAALYRPLGPLAAIAWLWIALGGLAMLGAWLMGRRPGP
jgi:hypothetical protein